VARARRRRCVPLSDAGASALRPPPSGREKEVFVELARRLAGATSADAVMDAVCEATDQILHWDSFCLAHRPAGEQRFQIVRVIDTVEGRRESFPGYHGTPLEFSKAVQQVFEGMPLLINRKPGESLPQLRLLGTKKLSASLMFVPVRCEGSVIGFLSAQSYTPGRYAESDLQFLQDAADAVAPAIERIRAEESLRRSQEILRVERDLALGLSATTDLRVALDRLLESCLMVEGVDGGGVYVKSDKCDDLDLMCHRGLSATFVECVSHVAADDHRGRLMACGQPQFLSRAELEAISGTCRAEGLRALACIPVISSERPVAVLNLVSRTLDEIPDGSRSALEAIAAQMGAAVARIRAEEGLREARDLLEKRVRERTAELLEANRRLQAEIAERGKVEQALRESEKRYRAIVQGQTELICRFTPDGTILFANDAYCRCFGVSPEQIVGAPFFPLVLEQDRAGVERQIASLSPENRLVTVEERVCLPDGSIRWQQWTNHALFTEEGEMFEVLAVGRDVTERKQAEEALREKEEQLRFLSENLAEGMVYQINTGPDGRERRFTYLSPAVERLHGLKLEDAWRDSALIYGQMLEEDRALLLEAEARAVATRTTFDMDARVRLPSGEIRWRRFISSPHVLPDGNLVWDGIELDITERKQAEEALRVTEQQLRRFGIEADRQLEKERMRISRELHDELGQMLTALNLNLVWLNRHMEKRHSAVTERFTESIDYVSRMITSVRSLSKSLRPAALSHHGLVEAAREHAGEFEQYSGISCGVSVDPENLQVPEPVATTAFRIMQEALTNVARHSRATKCSIEIQAVGEWLLMRISDNGVGLGSVDMPHLRSLGVTGMKERATMVGGRVTIENAPEGGVRVTARLPMRPKEPGSSES